MRPRISISGSVQQSVCLFDLYQKHLIQILRTIGRTSEESLEESSRKILFYFLEEKNFAWRKIAIDLIQKITYEMQSRDAEFKEKSCFMQ